MSLSLTVLHRVLSNAEMTMTEDGDDHYCAECQCREHRPDCELKQCLDEIERVWNIE